jgi:hypothetical protein
MCIKLALMPYTMRLEVNNFAKANCHSRDYNTYNDKVFRKTKEWKYTKQVPDMW